jgi:hypothetical protein
MLQKHAGLRLRRQNWECAALAAAKPCAKTESAGVIESEKGLRLAERGDELEGAVFGAKKRAFPRCLRELMRACESSWECRALLLMLMLTAVFSLTTMPLPSLALGLG